MNTEHIDKMIDALCDRIFEIQEEEDRSYRLVALAEVIKARAELGKISATNEVMDRLKDMMNF